MAELFFEEDGKVSLWAGQDRVEEGSDFLRDLYGVDYFDPDFQECFVADSKIDIEELIDEISYSESFRDHFLESARELQLSKATWLMAQFDFAYDQQKTSVVEMPNNPRFIGVFTWNEQGQ